MSQGIGEMNPQALLEMLFNKYSSSLYYFFLRKGLSQEDSKEMVQETFYRACRGQERRKDESNLKGWLYTIAANLWRNELRARRATKRERLELSLDAMVEEGGNFQDKEGEAPLQETLKRERRRQLYAAVADLPEQMRRCLVLRLRDDLKYEEIATVMQISVNTVKSQIFQAGKRLQNLLRPAGEVSSTGGRTV